MKKTNSKTPKFRSKFEKELYDKYFKKTKARYEGVRIHYTKPGIYIPDWFLPNGIIIEIKGRFSPADRAKHLRVKEQYLKEQYRYDTKYLDIRFLFKVNNTLYKGSNNRYSDWCDKHGFKYCFTNVAKDSKLPRAEKVVPKWLKEK